MPKIAILIAIGLIFFAASHSFAVEPEFVEVIEPEFMEVTDFEFMEVTDPEFGEVTEPEFAGVTGVEYFVTTAPRPGVTVLGGELKSVEYLMCAPVNGLPTPKECWYKGQ